MKVRGDRECKDCGARWSYYDTGSVTCPQCGSLRSVGVDDRKRHTAAPVTLNLSAVRERVDDAPLADVAEEAASLCREYLRGSGFIKAGELQPLADSYLAASELAHAADFVERSMRLDESEEIYFLTLLRVADQDDRPPRSDVPTSMRAARGLGYAKAVEDYRSEVRSYLEGNPDETVHDPLATLDEHRKRVQALDGDVPPSTADGLVLTAQAIGRYLIEDDEGALAEASHHLDRLDPGA